VKQHQQNHAAKLIERSEQTVRRIEIDTLVLVTQTAQLSWNNQSEKEARSTIS
jgi:hypothetical protein